MRIKPIAVCLLLGAAALIPAQAAHADPAGSGWTLVFSDDFNGTTVDTAKWNFRTDVKAFSAQRPENVTVSGGIMSINLKHESYAGKNFTGGGLVSKQPFRYGYYETRAKMNDGVGWHTSFWAMAGDGSTTFPAERKTEIDGFEIDSNSSPSLLRNIHSGVHAWNGSTDMHNVGTNYNSGLDLRQWHTYAFDWSETSVKFYVDGSLRFTAAYTPQDWTHDYINIWLTSIAYGTTPDTSFLPSAVQFDYIEYWQKDYYVDNDGSAAYGYSETGTWYNSSLTGWTVNSPTRYAQCHSAGHTATWRPNLRAAGTYQVYIHNIVHSGSDRNARYDVAGATTYINGTVGTSGWLLLGTHSLPAGTSSFVKLTSSGSGCARADAVKFVRV